MNLNSTTTISEIAADGHYYTEDVWNTFKGTRFQNIYTWSNEIPYESLSDWNSPYGAILTLNVILSESEKLNIHDNDIAHVRAQALFHRARLFFDLAQVFAPPYIKQTAHSDAGIPLRLSNDITESSKRASLEQTYQQIISDIKLAITNLPDTPEYLSRASKPAALALLARVYLAMGDYKNAGESADQCLAIKNTLLDYSTIAPTAGFIGVNAEVLFVSLLNPSSELTGNYLVDKSLFDLYDSDDLRKTVFFKNGSAGIQFKGTYGSSSTDLFAGLALDEVYLIRAECYARENNLSMAMKFLNDLLRSRWAKNADGTSKYVDQGVGTGEEVLAEILEERRKQLILRNIRWSDLKRLNLDIQTAITIERTIGGETYLLEPKSFRYQFPIPEEIIRQSAIEQNDGWKK